MQTSHAKNVRLAQMAILTAILVIMTFTPLGFIMIPPVAITLMHIPVIIGAISMGPVSGGALGLIFGLLSMAKATMSAVSPVDIAFSPFLSGSPVASILMCILPRVLLGVVAGLLFLGLKRIFRNDVIAMGGGAVIATVTHSLGVLGLLSLLFDQLPLKAVFETIIALNGVLEMLAAAVIATAVCKALKKVLKRA